MEKINIRKANNTTSSVNLLAYLNHGDEQSNGAFNKIDAMAKATAEAIRTRPKFSGMELKAPISVSKTNDGRGFYYSVQIKTPVDDRPKNTLVGATSQGYKYIDIIANSDSDSDFEEIVTIIESIEI